jgi:predicted Ser/Thr protein kinase
MEIHINRKYKVASRLGRGEYADVFAGKCIKSDADVAIKVEPINLVSSTLAYEARLIKNIQGERGFP